MIERAPGVTRLVDRLEAQGLVTRTRARDDRRQVRCTLTERGLTVLAALEAPVQAADAAMVDALDAAEFATLDERLARLSDAVRAQLGDGET
jgi:DNA-binding MarR family transcriptional regulator